MTPRWLPRRRWRKTPAAMYGGSHATLHPSCSAGLIGEHADLFVSGAYLQDDLGTDNVTPAPEAIHDRTQQYQGFALGNYPFAPGQKLSLVFSGADASFQIPDERGPAPAFAPPDAIGFDSARLDRIQHEQNYVGIVAYPLDTPAFSLLAAEIDSDQQRGPPARPLHRQRRARLHGCAGAAGLADGAF